MDFCGSIATDTHLQVGQRYSADGVVMSELQAHHCITLE